MNKTQVYRHSQPRVMMYAQPQTGAGFFQDIGNLWTKDINPFLKKSKILSTGLGAVAPLIPGFGGTVAGYGAGGLKQLGYGPKRRKGKKPGPKPKPKKKAVTRRKRK